jgi:hypothetical protein
VTAPCARRVSRPVLVVGAAIGTVLVLNGVALAFRSGNTALTGTGTATAVGDTFTFTLSGASTAGLYPGGPAGTVNVNVSNPFSRNVDVTNVTLAVAPSNGQGACGASDFTTDSSNLPAVVTPGSAGYAVSVAMKSTASNGCQGATVGLTVTVTGRLA